MEKSTAIRLILTAALLVFVWLDYKWALYLTITLLVIAQELTNLNVQRHR